MEERLFKILIGAKRWHMPDTLLLYLCFFLMACEKHEAIGKS